MTSTLPSQTPFAKTAAQARRSSRSAHVSQRAVSRAPFGYSAAPFEPANAAGETFTTTSASRILELSLGLSADELQRIAALSQVVESPYSTLRRRDRSVYAWFESVGLFLTLVAVAGACVALTLG
ncbi:MAG TPA: hypothetical protein VHF69_12890, partial [Candidatus Synoicihabitans sp.]|nr:hypothetical protein [Candidatus Synoicihabitans sp.]